LEAENWKERRPKEEFALGVTREIYCSGKGTVRFKMVGNLFVNLAFKDLGKAG
jgi:hypothetical protein